MTLGTERVMLRGTKTLRIMPVSTLADTPQEARQDGHKGHTRFSGKIIPLVYSEQMGYWKA